MKKNGEIDIIEELKIIWNNLIILSKNKELDKGKSMFIIHQTNRIERVLDKLGDSQ